MKILVIDGQGGGIGKSIIEQLLKAEINAEIIAVGTNSIASSSMLKAGAKAAATGENAVIFNAENADFIVGPIGIISANSMYGEISPNICAAISKSKAQKVLIPISQSRIFVVSSTEKPMQTYINELVEYIKTKITL